MRIIVLKKQVLRHLLKFIERRERKALVIQACKSHIAKFRLGKVLNELKKHLRA